MSESSNEAKQKLYDQSATTLFQLAAGLTSRGFAAVWDATKVNLAMRHYLDAYLRRYGHIKLLGMAEPLPLRQVYADVQVVGRDFLNRFRSIEELEDDFRNSNRQLANYGREQRGDAITIANSTRYLNVLGAPGAGKSTLLRRLGLEALMPRRRWRSSELFRKGDFQWSYFDHECIPVLIELRRFRSEKVHLEAAIRAEFEACGLEHANDFVYGGLRDGKFMLLFDGLDEVSNEKLDQVVQAVRDFVSAYPANWFVTSCRTAFYKTFFTQFTDVVIADFDEAAIRNLIDRWFSSALDRDLGVAAAFWSEMKQQPSTLELARTPLLLTFMCIVYDRTQGLQPNRTALYRRALEILLDKWAGEKRVHNEPVYRELYAELEIEMLADFAGIAFEDDRLFFGKSELLESFAKFMDSEFNAPRIDAQRLLEAIEVQQGLLVERAPDVYSFSHLTIQEFLAAHEYRSAGRVKEIVERYLFDERWREVFTLLAGAIRADELLDAMVLAMRQFVRERPALAIFFRETRSCGLRLHPVRDRVTSFMQAAETLLSFIEAMAPTAASEASDLEIFLRNVSVGRDRLRQFCVALTRADGGDEVSGVLFDTDAPLYMPHTRGTLTLTPQAKFVFALISRCDEALQGMKEAKVVAWAQATRESLRTLRARVPHDIEISGPYVDELVKLISTNSGASFDDLRDGGALPDFVAYLHAAMLLCDVARAALRISPSAWQIARASLFQPNEDR